MDMNPDSNWLDEMLADIAANPTPAADLAAPIERAAKAAPPAETYPCDSCGGTGRFRGVRIHQPESRCFACNGRGYFKTSTADRFKARKQVADRKARTLAAGVAAFTEAHGELVAGLRAVRDWNGFAAEMLTAIAERGGLSDRQIDASRNMLAKVEASRAAKAAAKTANSGTVDVSRIESLFATARANGLKRVAFVAGDLRIAPAKESSVNAGALYVQRNGDYQGKVMNGRFLALRETLADTLPRLLELAADPAGVARFYGQKTGTCSCCGRELTDPESIAAGIGPVCATKWGL